MSRLAAKKCYDAAGLKPSDIDVVELHDCFSANELITYEALGLCPEGKTADLKTLIHPPAILKLGSWRIRAGCFPPPSFHLNLRFVLIEEYIDMKLGHD